MVERSDLERLSRQLADNGKLIEAGWMALRAQAVPLSASAAQIDDMRLAFMGGAQHLFASIMTILDPGSEPPRADLRRMELIHRELEAFATELKLRLTTGGRA